MDAIRDEYFSEEMYNIIDSCLRNLNPKGVSFFSESRKGDDIFIPEIMNVNKVELLPKSQSESGELIFRVYIDSYYMYITLRDINNIRVYIDGKDMDFITTDKGDLHITLSKAINTL
jgi:intergrase/recombinase